MRYLFLTIISLLSFIAIIPILTKIWFWLTKQWLKLWRSNTKADTKTEDQTTPSQTKDN